MRWEHLGNEFSSSAVPYVSGELCTGSAHNQTPATLHTSGGLASPPPVAGAQTHLEVAPNDPTRCIRGAGHARKRKVPLGAMLAPYDIEQGQATTAVRPQSGDGAPSTRISDPEPSDPARDVCLAARASSIKRAASRGPRGNFALASTPAAAASARPPQGEGSFQMTNPMAGRSKRGSTTFVDSEGGSAGGSAGGGRGQPQAMTGSEDEGGVHARGPPHSSRTDIGAIPGSRLRSTSITSRGGMACCGGWTQGVESCQGCCGKYIVKWMVDKVDFREQSVHLAFKAYRQENMYHTTRGTDYTRRRRRKRCGVVLGLRGVWAGAARARRVRVLSVVSRWEPRRHNTSPPT